MGILDTVKAATIGNKAYRTHVDGNKLAADGRPAEAGEKYRTAMKLYEEAAKLGNNAQNVMQGYAVLLLREGEFERARELLVDLSKAKNLTKDNLFEIRIQYSIYQWKTGQLDKAIETIGRAAAYKMNGTVYGTLGMYWVDKARETGDFSKALEFNMEAMEYDDEDAATLDNMAQLYESMAVAEPDRAGEYREKALGYYKKAHKAKPRQITTLYYLARMYHQRGDDERARKLLAVRDTLYFSAICPITRDMMEQLAAEVG